MPETNGYDSKTNYLASLENGTLQEPFALDMGKFVFVAGSSNVKLARNVAEKIRLQTHTPAKRFADGEIQIQFDGPDVNFRGRDALIFQSISPPDPNRAYMETLFMADAIHRSDANKIRGVFPYCAYLRQDRKGAPHEPISGALVLQILQDHGHFSEMMIVHPHAESLAGVAPIPIDFLPGDYVLGPAVSQYIAEYSQMEPGRSPFIDALIAPDEGELKRTTKDVNRMDPRPNLGFISKVRDVYKTDTIASSSALYGIANLKRKNALVRDDIIGSGKTMREAAMKAYDLGAKVYVAAAHGVFTPGCLEYLMDPAIERIFVTDTIDNSARLAEGGDLAPAAHKIQIVTVADMLAEAIYRNHTGESLSQKFFNRGNQGIQYT